jgi:hypothetical protein
MKSGGNIKYIKKNIKKERKGKTKNKNTDKKLEWINKSIRGPRLGAP